MADYKKIIQSPQFTFLVGENRTPMMIHADIVQNMSQPLCTLINNGHMKESINRVAVLNDIDPEIFATLCEYRYAGRYTTPDILSSGRGRTENGERRRDDEDTLPTGNLEIPGNRTHGARGVIETLLYRQFASLEFSGDRAIAFSDPDILFHAQLYVLATRFLVEPLRQQCLKSLHRDLDKLGIIDDAWQVMDFLT